MTKRLRTVSLGTIEDFRYIIAATIVCSLAACTVPNDDPYAVMPQPKETDSPSQPQTKRDAGTPSPMGTGGTSGQPSPQVPDAALVEIDTAMIPLGSGGTTPPPLMGGMGMGGTTPPPGTGGMGGSGGIGSTGGVTTPPLERAKSYDFETDTQNWIDLHANGSVIARTTAKAATGTASLAVMIDTQTNPANGTERYIGVPRDLTPVLQPGQTVKYRVWIPSGNKLIGVQPFVVTQGTSRAGVGRWQGTFTHVDALSKDTWNTINVVLPADYEVNDLEQVGVQFLCQAGGWKGTVYIDAVTF
jgi:hypothetical protein